MELISFCLAGGILCYMLMYHYKKRDEKVLYFIFGIIGFVITVIGIFDAAFMIIDIQEDVLRRSILRRREMSL